MPTTYNTTVLGGLFREDPTQALVDFVNDTKPYHTKILDVFVQYEWTDPLNALAKDKLLLINTVPVPVGDEVSDPYDVDGWDSGGYSSLSWAVQPAISIPLNAIHSLTTTLPSFVPIGTEKLFVIPGIDPVIPKSVYAFRFDRTRQFRLIQSSGVQPVGLDVVWQTQTFPIISLSSLYFEIVGDYTGFFVPGFLGYTQQNLISNPFSLPTPFTVATSTYNGSVTRVNVLLPLDANAQTVNSAVVDLTQQLTYVIALPQQSIALSTVQPTVTYQLEVTTNIAGVDPVLGTWRIQGNYTGTSLTPFTVGSTFVVSGNTETNSNGVYTIVSSVSDTIFTNITVQEPILSTATATGNILLSLNNTWSVLSLLA